MHLLYKAVVKFKELGLILQYDKDSLLSQLNSHVWSPLNYAELWMWVTAKLFLPVCVEKFPSDGKLLIFILTWKVVLLRYNLLIFLNVKLPVTASSVALFHICKAQALHQHDSVEYAFSVLLLCLPTSFHSSFSDPEVPALVCKCSCDCAVIWLTKWLNK